MKKFILKLALLVSPLMLFAAAPAFAALNCSSSDLSTSEAIQCGANGGSGNNQDASQATSNLDNTVSSIVNVLSIAVGVISVIMIIIAGARFVTSSGNQEGVAAARRMILYAAIGLVIVALSQIIVHFVLGKTNKATTTAMSSQVIDKPMT